MRRGCIWRQAPTDHGFSPLTRSVAYDWVGFRAIRNLSQEVVLDLAHPDNQQAWETSTGWSKTADGIATSQNQADLATRVLGVDRNNGGVWIDEEFRVVALATNPVPTLTWGIQDAAGLGQYRIRLTPAGNQSTWSLEVWRTTGWVTLADAPGNSLPSGRWLRLRLEGLPDLAHGGAETRTQTHQVLQGSSVTASCLVCSFDQTTNWTSNGARLASPIQKTEGQQSLGFWVSGWTPIASVPFSTTTVRGTGAHLGLDVFVPWPQSNPTWLGSVQLGVNCPSAGIWNQSLGQMDLTHLFVNEFNSLTFPLNSQLQQVLKENHPDFQWTINVNSNQGAGWFRLDNLRLLP